MYSLFQLQLFSRTILPTSFCTSPSIMIALLATTAWLLVSYAAASTPADWRQITSIYQVVTDRFARTDNSTTAPCDLNARDYCGGTWQGIINRLDYIQGMGFDAVSLRLSRLDPSLSLLNLSHLLDLDFSCHRKYAKRLSRLLGERFLPRESLFWNRR